MKFVAISDTHAQENELDIPDGDVLLHAGDITKRGSVGDVTNFGMWLSNQPHTYKVIIAGNHDFCFEDPQRHDRAVTMLTNDDPKIFYLQDDMVTINGVNIYGSPWQPWFHDWAFNVERGERIAQKWEKIPNKTDILITHGPPHGFLDQVKRGNKRVGCKQLKKAVERVEPDYHVFGHIHEGFGREEDSDGVHYINASKCNLDYNVRPETLTFEYSNLPDSMEENTNE